jgi:hypothetical protein
MKSIKAVFKGIEFEIEDKEQLDFLTGVVEENIVEDFDNEIRVSLKKVRPTRRQSRKRRVWTRDEDAFLIANEGKSIRQLKKALGRSKMAIRVRLCKLKSKRAKVVEKVKPKEPKKGRRRKWSHFTEEEDAFIKENASKMTVYALAKKLGRRASSTYGRIVKLGLGKGEMHDSLEKRTTRAKKALTFDALAKHPDLQQVASDLVISCAEQKTSLKLKDLVDILDLEPGEAKVLLVDIFNSQNKIYSFIGRTSGKIVWKGNELTFR